jgi:hypothetical protein
MLLTILAIGSVVTGLGSLIFGAVHQRKAANTLRDIHGVLSQADRRR